MEHKNKKKIIISETVRYVVLLVKDVVLRCIIFLALLIWLGRRFHKVAADMEIPLTVGEGVEGGWKGGGRGWKGVEGGGRGVEGGWKGVGRGVARCGMG